MPADEQFTVVDKKAMMSSPFYHCHNKPRPVANHPVPSKCGTYPYRFSTECRYDISMTDSRCKGCVHAKTFEDWHKK